MILIRQVGSSSGICFVTASCVCVCLSSLSTSFQNETKDSQGGSLFSSSGVFVAFNFRPVLLENHVFCLSRRLLVHRLYILFSFDTRTDISEKKNISFE